MKRAVIAVFVIFLSLPAYVGYRAFTVSRLQTVRPARGDIASSVYASGKTQAEKEAQLSFRNTGRITSLPFKKNQEVKKGQVVATIDTSDLVANKEKEMQDYLKTRWDFEQARDTYKDTIKTDTIQRILDKSQFDLNNSVTNVEIADRAIQNSSLYAPYDGIVTQIGGDVNEWVSVFSTTPLITVTDPQSVYFAAELEEADIGKIQVGQQAIVTLDAYPDTPFPGVVADIERKTLVKDNGDTMLPVKVAFTQTTLPLVGLNGDVQFVLEKKTDILLVPRRAVKKKNGSAVVAIKDGMRVKTVQVATGIADAKNIEVQGGLSERDVIVLPGELE